jgi:hypothetical protein
MKIKQAVDLAVRWSGGDRNKALEICQRQAELDPKLREEVREEAADYFVMNLIEELLTRGYSLERPDELVEAVISRLKSGPVVE